MRPRPTVKARALRIFWAALFFLGGLGHAQETTPVPLADGFDCPVGRDGTKEYFKARGYRPNGHLGEDWNGVGGGDTDLGDPVYSAGRGLVVFARNYGVGWGNVIILRHAYLENGQTQFVDSLYGHLHQILIHEGDQITRGQKIGTIGNNRGMYDAHLHFEMRKNLRIGMFRNSFPRDLTCYWDPTEFIAARRTLSGAGAMAAVPINTFAMVAPPLIGAPAPPDSPLRHPALPGQPARKNGGTFKIDRYEDLRN